MNDLRPPDEQKTSKTGTHLLVRWLAGAIRVLLPIVVVAAGGAGALYFVKTRPKAPQRPPTRTASLVDVRTVKPDTHRVHVSAMGTVLAAREVVLQSRVQGEVVEVSEALVPGGHIAAGDFLLRIDPRDYELAVEEAQSRVAQAEYELKLEQGHQDIARREWELLGADADASDLDRELALRQPHLRKAQASLAAAEAALDKAQLNLSRTVITAPFNGVITAKNIDLGAQATAQTALATLVGTDEYWVQASVPVDQLPWIDIPKDDTQPGAVVRVRQYLGTDTWAEWQGSVIRLLSELDPAGRMARLLVRVPDPLGMSLSEPGDTPLLIGAYVDLEIVGRDLPDAYDIGRNELHDSTCLWVMDETDRLSIRPVGIAFRGRQRVLVTSGLSPGDRIIISDLPAPVAGMPLRLAQENPTPGGPHATSSQEGTDR